MLKQVLRAPSIQFAFGALVARYLKCVYATNRLTYEPSDTYERIKANAPVIFAMWHGQHFLIPPVTNPPGQKKIMPKLAALVSRHGDGALNAAVLHGFDIVPVRGSGGNAEKMHRRGGVAASRALLRLLQEGYSVALTADIPKRARICGLGIVTLAKLSGRPIIAAAVVTSRRMAFKSWDKACLSLPFGRGMVAISAPIWVEKHATTADLEATRQQVEAELNRLHARAFAFCGAQDPFADSQADFQGH